MSFSFGVKIIQIKIINMRQWKNSISNGVVGVPSPLIFTLLLIFLIAISIHINIFLAFVIADFLYLINFSCMDLCNFVIFLRLNFFTQYSIIYFLLYIAKNGCEKNLDISVF